MRRGEGEGVAGATGAEQRPEAKVVVGKGAGVAREAAEMVVAGIGVTETAAATA